MKKVRWFCKNCKHTWLIYVAGKVEKEQLCENCYCTTRTNSVEYLQNQVQTNEFNSEKKAAAILDGKNYAW